MNFFKRLFQLGSKQESGEYVDRDGLYFEIVCGKCQKEMRVRADKKHDLNLNDDGLYEWHKTVMCDGCFHKMATLVQMNSRYEITSKEIGSNGRFL